MQVNDSVTFRLLKRPRDSIIPMEVHPSPDSSTNLGEESNQFGMETTQTTWSSGRGHKGATSVLSSTGDKTNTADRAKEGKHLSKIKQGIKESEEYGGMGFNKYAKFTRVGDGKAFWKAAAQELASYAAQVCGSAVLCCVVICCVFLQKVTLNSLCCALVCPAMPC